MSRHRDYRDPQADAEEPQRYELEEAPGSRVYTPVGRRGPASTCAPDIIVQVAKSLAKGLTRRQAAALAGVEPETLKSWIKRGREESAEGKESILTALAFEVDCAEAHYQAELIEIGNKAAVDKNLSDKWVRWRLAVASPKEFTIPAASTGPTSQGLGPAFELVTPEEAMGFLTEKLTRFLEEDEKNAALLESLKTSEPSDAGS